MPRGHAHDPSLDSDRFEGEKTRVMSFLREFWAFMRARRKFWLYPVVLFMLVIGGLVVLSEGSAMAPWLYTVF